MYVLMFSKNKPKDISIYFCITNGHFAKGIDYEVESTLTVVQTLKIDMCISQIPVRKDIQERPFHLMSLCSSHAPP
jgi:hypothetical protein